MFTRALSDQIIKAANSFYAVAVIGPRQSGKTTLLRSLLPGYRYINLEDPDMLSLVKEDPRGLFSDSSTKWIIDEAQECPELFSYLLGFIDNNKVSGQFVLICSKNFLMMKKIKQSLAGRIAILELLPLTYSEFATYGDFAQKGLWEMIYNGGYPGLYNEHISAEVWYRSYISTYLQRDVRQLINVKDLTKFHLFLKLCAARHGQIINLTDIGSACGISHTTVSELLNLLELIYIVFRLQPYYKNFNKRLIKSPKLYFYDSGVVCHLLGIKSGEHAEIHANRGALFEGYVISEIVKLFFTKAQTPNIYFWNSHKGFEIDLLIEKAEHVHAIEIKSSSTYLDTFTRQLKKWQALDAENNSRNRYVIYAGDKSLKIDDISILPYQNIYEVM